MWDEITDPFRNFNGCTAFVPQHDIKQIRTYTFYYNMHYDDSRDIGYWKMSIEKINFILHLIAWNHSPQLIRSHAILFKLIRILTMDFPVWQNPGECWHDTHFRSVQTTKDTHGLIYCGTINGITCFTACINTHTIYVSVISLVQKPLYEYPLIVSYYPLPVKWPWLIAEKWTDTKAEQSTITTELHASSVGYYAAKMEYH